MRFIARGIGPDELLVLVGLSLLCLALWMVAGWPAVLGFVGTVFAIVGLVAAWHR